MLWADAVVSDQGLGVGAVSGGDAGGGDEGGGFFGGGDGVVEVEELLEEVLFVGESVGGEGGGVEGGVGVFEGVPAGQFEGAVEGAESAGEDFEGGGADAAVAMQTTASICFFAGDCGQGKVSKTDSGV